jgi:hypothetical protein
MKPCTLTFLLAGTLLAGSAIADTAQFDAPDFDRWNYPFNQTPGIRSTAASFSAYGQTLFDNRDGQFLVGFDTAAVLPPLGPGETLQINAVTLTATHFTGEFLYDPTYDSYRTRLDPADPNYLADADDGIPIILVGVGFRSGYVACTFDSADAAGPPFFSETEPYAFADPTLPDVRHAFAAAYDDLDQLVNISNNLEDGVEVTPFAVGTTNLQPGDMVIQGVAGVNSGSTFAFDLNLADPNVLAYVQTGIAHGGLFFTITSLHPASQEVSGLNPIYYTKENFDPAAKVATLSIDYDIIQEALPCPADIDLSGAVDVNDFFALLQNWGDCPAAPDPCPWDIAGDGEAPDGIVGVDDFFALLQNWGPCPTAN